MCLKGKKYNFWKSKKIIFEHDTAIKKVLVHQWILKIKIYVIYLQKYSSELVYAWWNINSNCKFLAPLDLTKKLPKVSELCSWRCG